METHSIIGGIYSKYEFLYWYHFDDSYNLCTPLLETAIFAIHLITNYLCNRAEGKAAALVISTIQYCVLSQHIGQIMTGNVRYTFDTILAGYINDGYRKGLYEWKSK